VVSINKLKSSSFKLALAVNKSKNVSSDVSLSLPVVLADNDVIHPLRKDML
jgi:hypothetical protein